MTRRAVLLSVPVALLAYTQATASRPVLWALAVVALLALGALAGWRAVPVVVAVYVVASIVDHAFFWYDDPALTGIDDMPPEAGVLLVLPVWLAVVGLGVAGRQLRRFDARAARSRRACASRATAG